MRVGRRKDIVAAGAIVWRLREGELQVLAVHRPQYDDWSWPKGKIRRGETRPECAMREVFEETGKEVVLTQPLPTLTYVVPNGRSKTVSYWAAQTTSTAHPSLLARPTYRVARKREVDNTRWLTVAKARRKITSADDVRVLDALVASFERGHLDTRAFIVARHARARRRTAWVHEDLLRPITPGGGRRANQLVHLFSAFGIRHVASSPALRCVVTVEPYAAAIGKRVKTHENLTEEAHAANPAGAATLLSELLARPGNTVVCVHRPTMPTIMTMLSAATRAWTKGKLPNKDPYLPAGGVLIAHVVDTESGPRIAALEKHRLG